MSTQTKRLTPKHTLVFKKDASEPEDIARAVLFLIADFSQQKTSRPSALFYRK